MKPVLIVLLFFLSFSFYSVIAQNIQGIIRGEIVDGETKRSLPGATVVVIDVDPVIGCVSDENGHFILKNVSVGRHKIVFSFIGYKEVVLNDPEVVSGKELVLNIEMTELSVLTSEVVVKAQKNKGSIANEMATISARPFTVDETSKYAGSWGDPSRMASKFAGVTISTDERNDIVVRGNSPIGLLWRIDGVDIPNPNHFSVAGSSGGAISMINNNLLTNSDFFTGAFPAEYGNAISAVFDLHMRKGNTENHEYFAQAGVNGFELGAEGPFSKAKRSSYLFSYRYSTLAVLDKLGISIIDAIPNFQDLSFKLYFPLIKGDISVFGIGGMSKAVFEPVMDSLKWKNNNDYMKEISGSGMGVIGVSYFRPLGKESYTRIILSSSIDKPFYSQDSVGYDYLLYRKSEADYMSGRNSIHGFINTKVGKKLKMRTGLIFNRYFIHNEVNYYSWFPVVQKNRLSTLSINTILSQGYIQGKFNVLQKWSLHGGLHAMCFFLNNRYSIEPRISLRFVPNSLHSLSIGYGQHSQILPLPVYFVQIEDSLGTISYPNQNLDFFHSNHYIFSYDWQINENLRFKMEWYYQKINGAANGNERPVYSLLNFGAGDDIVTGESFNGNGKGENYGVEITLEKFLHKGWYFLTTGSLFDSKYKDGNDTWRNSRFNTSYAWNVLGGKEFKVGKHNSLGLNVTIVNIGGQHYIPIDLEASRIANTAMYIDSLAYRYQYTSYSRIDFRIKFRFNHKHFSQEIAFELGNAFDRKNIEHMYFDKYSGTIKYKYQLPRVPIVFYRVEF